MSRTDPQYRFRPPPELAAKLDEYCQRERRRSVNEALIVLVSMALEHDREARGRLAQTSKRGPVQTAYQRMAGTGDGVGD